MSALRKAWAACSVAAVSASFRVSLKMTQARCITSGCGMERGTDRGKSWRSVAGYGRVEQSRASRVWYVQGRERQVCAWAR